MTTLRIMKWFEDFEMIEDLDWTRWNQFELKELLSRYCTTFSILIQSPFTATTLSLFLASGGWALRKKPLPFVPKWRLKGLSNHRTGIHPRHLAKSVWNIVARITQRSVDLPQVYFSISFSEGPPFRENKGEWERNVGPLKDLRNRLGLCEWVEDNSAWLRRFKTWQRTLIYCLIMSIKNLIFDCIRCIGHFLWHSSMSPRNGGPLENDFEK